MAEQQILFPASSDGGDGDDSLTLARFAQQAYLDYAISVVKGRALPDGWDGQKLVQRRILFAMNELGLDCGARPVKSARVVGDVLGSFIRMATSRCTTRWCAWRKILAALSADRRPRKLRLSRRRWRSGDALHRSTTDADRRLLLDEIDKGTVDFMPNYDGSTQEPRLLPAGCRSCCLMVPPASLSAWRPKFRRTTCAKSRQRRAAAGAIQNQSSKT